MASPGVGMGAVARRTPTVWASRQDGGGWGRGGRNHGVATSCGGHVTRSSGDSISPCGGAHGGAPAVWAAKAAAGGAAAAKAAAK
jgi:hypothetical protein